MLWHKAWIDTRSRFLIGLGLLILSAASTVLIYPQVSRLMPAATAHLDLNSPIGRAIAQSLELSRTYRGYVWLEVFMNNIPKAWSLFAILLGAGGLLSQASRGGALFTLSLPVSRERLIEVRAGTALAELLVLAIVPAVVVVLMSPAIGHSYSLVDALVHGTCLFIGGTVLFSLTFLLATVFSDLWRPPLIVAGLAMCVSFLEQGVPGVSRYSLFGVMGAEAYFRDGAVPWIGLLITASASAAMLYLARNNIARHDF
jgi:ABC-type transport system involved in multi-copper enzyme maturation permease subunit